MKYEGNTAVVKFNSSPSTILHVDLNSCFATIEQQANPFYRGKCIAVAAYDSPGGCILAPSVEAKAHGIKTGMRVRDGRMLYPKLIVLKSDPWKYRNVHLKLRKLVSRYTSDFYPKSIDEFVLDLGNFPILKRKSIQEVGREIKERIRSEIGDWTTVSIGIAPNRYLAKIAAGLHKPDGLDEINHKNHKQIYSSLVLADLTGIKEKNIARLNMVGVYTVADFYGAALSVLRAAFRSVNSYYWYLRLRGWEIDDVEFGRKSYGNSYALSRPLVNLEDLSPILAKLVVKMSSRFRRAGYLVGGVHVGVGYRDGSFWHKGVKSPEALSDDRQIYKRAYGILSLSPYKKPVRELAVSCFNLSRSGVVQLELFGDVEKRNRLTKAIDEVNGRWGNFVITPARMTAARSYVPDRISFGNVKELEEFTCNDTDGY
jgi:DNA polymerase IV